MIRKSAKRFSEKIMLRQRPKAPRAFGAQKEILPGIRAGKRPSKEPAQKEFKYTCFRPRRCDIVLTFQMVKTMSQSAFDPFGEPVPAVDSSAASEGVSKWLKTAGTSVFWVLVIGIVLARAVYFEPGVFSFGHAVAWVQGLFAAL